SVGQLAPRPDLTRQCAFDLRLSLRILQGQPDGARFPGHPLELCAGFVTREALPPMDQVRIDKWLWAARFFKARGAATEAVLAGNVRINGVRAKPAKDVRAGDTVDVRVGHDNRTVVVRGLADKRGPAAAAALLYDETAESTALREQNAAQRRLA